ncbi:NRDE family protein [Marinobacter sp. S0848L]|uniref:NRDE family protein n=1 Tax=Marinobacter sp. S0848L TaxID=2926423 RepID=UPI001FF60C40|nr:NRDE family protein [Marinobacter sp. S0848L]MCK0106164.1 NRDE family protein [Marinobacter sp. S0848L]
MCTIVFAIGQSRQYPLVVAANRDEFYRRPTAAMDWWTSDNGQKVLAGQDLESGGTWLAVAPDGRVTAVTNVREGSPEAGRCSRGELPLKALSLPYPELKDTLASDPGRYSGFNLVSLSPDSGWYYSNRDAHPGRQVFRGIYGLSNHLLQTPWPKLLRLRTAVGQSIDTARADTNALHSQLISVLQDTTPAPDNQLPDTGVGLDTERFLSSPFISGEHYGTRATTIVTLSALGEIQVTEQSWGPFAQELEKREFRWQR